MLGTTTLAYFAATSVMKKKVITLTPDQSLGSSLP